MSIPSMEYGMNAAGFTPEEREAFKRAIDEPVDRLTDGELLLLTRYDYAIGQPSASTLSATWMGRWREAALADPRNPRPGSPEWKAWGKAVHQQLLNARWS